MAPLIESLRLDALKELASERFGVVTPAEEEVLRLCASTEFARPGELEVRPEISGEFLRWLATDSEATSQLDSLGLRVNNCIIATPLNLNFCKLPFPVNLRHCEVNSELSLAGAQVSVLNLYKCQFRAGVMADGLRSEGSVFLRRTLSLGPIGLIGAQIGGDLDCTGAEFSSKVVALNANRANIKGNVFLRDGFRSSGELRFLGTEIKGDLVCSGATLTVTGKAISADRVSISGGVFIDSGFTANGQIRFHGAQIGGNFDCKGATLRGKADPKLSRNENLMATDNARTAGNVLLSEGFVCEGNLRFHSTEVGGYFTCDKSNLRSLHCQHIRIRSFFEWTAIEHPKQTELNLLGATIGILRDEVASWPALGDLTILALEYRNLSEHNASSPQAIADETPPGHQELEHSALNAHNRIQWLKLQKESDRLEPHVWMWLAKLLKEKDDIAGYRSTICEYRSLRARASRNPLRRTLGLLLAEIERNPWSIFSIFLPLLLLGTVIFWAAASSREIRPTNHDAYGAWLTNEHYELAYPRFNPLLYTLENELPLIKFGIDDKWGPDPNLVTSGNPQLYWFLAGFRWLLIAAGWIQGILLTVGINRRFRD